MKNLFTLIFCLSFIFLQAQNAAISGVLQDDQKEPVQFSNIVLYQSSDSTMVKVEPSDMEGKFKFSGLSSGSYYLVATYVGLADLNKADLILNDGQTMELGDGRNKARSNGF